MVRIGRILPVAAILQAVALTLSHAAVIDFTGISASLVTSSAGQDFSYMIGSGPAVGTLNVRHISGDISQLTTGSSPDLTGFYVLQSGALAPVLFRFTFDQPRRLHILSNETLTSLETNTLQLPSGSSDWTVFSFSNASMSASPLTISFVGLNKFGPYGQFALGATAPSFDFLVTNEAGFPIYGSALSLDVLDMATATQSTSWGRLKAMFR